MEPLTPGSCSAGALFDPTVPDLQEIRELRSSKLDGKDLPQELYIYKRPLHPSEIQGCVIMDTCAVVIDPSLIELSVKNQILVMIPFPVLKELDKLHKSSKSPILKKKAQLAMQCLRKWVSNRYVFMETSSEEKVRGFVAAPNDNDDLILKCAYRIHASLPDDCPRANKIFFVTNDCNLSLKATAHGVMNFTPQVYLKLLHDSGLVGAVEEEEPMDVDPLPDPEPVKHVKPSSRSATKEKGNKIVNENVVKKPLSGQVTKHRDRKGKPKKADSTKNSHHSEKTTLTASLPKTEENNSLKPTAAKERSVKADSYHTVSGAHNSLPGRGIKAETVRSQKSLSNHGDTKAKADTRWYCETRHDSYYQHLPLDGVKRAAFSQRNSLQHYPTLNKWDVKSHLYMSQYPGTSRCYAYPKDNRIQTYATGGHLATSSQISSELPRIGRRDQREQKAHLFEHQRGQYQGPPKPQGLYERSNLHPRIPTKMMKRLSIVEQQEQQQRNSYESEKRLDKSYKQRERACGAQRVKISSTSPAEHALMKFLTVWNGLTEKLIDKIERGLSSEKVRMDIRKLYDCAAKLCEKTDLDSFKELVRMSTSLYYFITFDPDYQNLEFASSALVSGLQLMMNRSSPPAVDLVESILRFVNDPRVVV